MSTDEALRCDCGYGFDAQVIVGSSPRVLAEPHGIGGWLVLPAIGLGVGPVVGGLLWLLALMSFANVAASGQRHIFLRSTWLRCFLGCC